MVKGLLIDIDGTLVLSNEAHARSWVETFEHFGRQAEFERVVKLMGMGGDKIIPTLFPDLSRDEGLGKQITEFCTQLFKEKYAPYLQPAPGARDLIARLHQLGVQMIAASSANQEELEVLLEVADVSDLLTEHTTSSDAEQSKPAPDIVGVALERIGLPPEDVLMLGDSPFDIRAAGKLGVGVVAVRCGGFTDEKLAGAKVIYDDPQDLLSHLSMSPLG